MLIKRFITFSVKTNSYELLEDYLLYNYDYPNYIYLLSEKVRYNKNIMNSFEKVKQHIKDCNFTNFQAQKILNLLKVGPEYYVSFLLENKLYFNITNFLHHLNYSKIDYEECIKTIANSNLKNDNKQEYFYISAGLLSFDDKCAKYLDIFNEEFYNFLCKNYSASFYCIENYVKNLNLEQFKIFENIYLEYAAPEAIYNFAVFFKDSDKRKCFVKLLSYNNNRLSSKFAKKFSEFSNLLSYI